jgi:hypothetical protein
MRHFGIAFDGAVIPMRGLLPMNMGREADRATPARMLKMLAVAPRKHDL